MVVLPVPDRTRRLARTVLALALALAVALSVQATLRGWMPRAAMSASAAALVPSPVLHPLATVRPIPAAPVESAAPAAGTTGTTALPALPLAALAAPSPADLGIVAARPFRFGQPGVQDRTRALECLTAAVYYEAAGEPDAGQQAVAQVVLNRVRHPAFPATVCGVVYQGAAHAGCQFSFACDGSLQRRLPAAAGWARAARIAAAALAGHVYAPVGLATHYHSYAVTPAWNRSLVMTAAVGAHFFHRWKGWWGTPAAFRQIYAGGEPLPGPPAAVTSASPVIATAAAPPAGAAPVTPAGRVKTAWQASGTLRDSPATIDHLPPAATILPRWAESGRPLR